ncbi:penicillin acylase family protein [Chitinophaga pendula]|uniref:penicillin acylase family protein n=1 Tax=Chitinophaga TaxID=79328 RepID=UPI000BB0C64B|nr:MULTISPECIES: penicillin acylase family protein [Chitinophaga]ASZ13748.1 penicillin acylase family protein [Chitinophaga sp. MD30]UCJ08632.1 penicillin acylase family protein [Chitinophaga pendula]
MKYIYFGICTAITLTLIVALDHKIGALPPLGRLLSPQHGFWQNAEPIGSEDNAALSLPGLKGKGEVWLDDRMVPHIFADNENDAYFIQGYLHAKDRLWQMELQILAAGGRLSEILGPKFVEYDRTQRRMGMGYAAEQAAGEMEKDPITREVIKAYTAGINAYVHTLSYANLPLEYKLLDYRPEEWNAVKTGLLLKMMSYDLSGSANDLEYTNARRYFSKKDFDLLYPDFTDTLDPIIPKGTSYAAASRKAVAPPDTVLRQSEVMMKFREDKPDPDNGSNNWAVGGSKTRSGAPILCSDPHLGLSLPSLWYEVQIITPKMNVYGVSIPGAPGVIIGFNDAIAWGATNGMEDVKDYYRMEFRDGQKKQYLFNGQYRDAVQRVETIKVRGGNTVRDTVAYTVWGPVMFDNTFPDKTTKASYLAMRWKAHDPSNELITFYKLNHARNYDDYLAALQHYTCPAQNFVFASKSGDIGIWHNGQYPLRWKDQGKWIMPGSDSTYAWQGYIPQAENPHSKNPARGFESSANQHPTDSTYPYRLFGDYDLYRGKRINDQLMAMSQITPQDMMALQTDNMNLFAQTAMPLIRRQLDTTGLKEVEKKYWQVLSQWDLHNAPDSKGATLFSEFWLDLEQGIWKDDMTTADSATLKYPQSKTTLLWLLRDPGMHFVDNKETPEKETLAQLMHASFAKIAVKADSLDKAGVLAWGKFRGTDIRHLTRSLPAFSRMHLNTGGGAQIVNATKQTHGPSWRMVVEMGEKVTAYGIYPGGQSGNPGSPYYDNAVSDWVGGNYYLLHIFDRDHKDDAGIKYKMMFTPETAK